MPKIELDSKFVRFLLIGMINTLFGYGFYFLLIKFGVHFSLAVLISTCIGVLFNFKTIGKFVFKEPNNKLIFKFIALYSFLYFINIFGIQLLNDYGISFELSGFIMLMPMAILSFILNKKLVFES